MQAFLCRQLLVVVLLNTVPPPCVQGQELNDFRGVVQQAHDATFEKYTKNLDLEVVEEFYERTGTDSKIYKRYYHTYTSSARRWKLLSRAQDDPPYPIKVLTGSREGIYCLTIADASGTGKLSVREPNGPDMYHTICRADMGIAPQLAYFEGSIHSYLALPDMKVEKVSPEVWDGVTLTCATVSRPLIRRHSPANLLRQRPRHGSHRHSHVDGKDRCRKCLQNDLRPWSGLRADTLGVRLR